ncbi:CAAX prenyl protease 2 [Trypanosoma cruzi cruzi]|uniref:intramembrane prenyl-peptidase Rce1 n=1 Tax=Trypanosoma cruzi TaxID=5693 RepID=A0A2V2URD1_TRYCR|nr:CAAX prenyl protease 2 [Trypanosoma cruzi cruzi]PWU86907.1 putative CAAX amino terminal protease [Trypanosoma cruzi]
MTDIALCTFISGSFIGSIYAWPKEHRFACLCIRNLKEASRDGPHRVIRDDPSTIRRRMVSFVGATGMSMMLLEKLLRKEPGDCQALLGSSLLRYIICSERSISQSMVQVAETGVATLLLFSGSFLEGVRFPRWSDTDHIIFFRNYILAPFGEEIFFRALLLHLLRRRPVASSIVISSIFFALCHTHHIFTIAAEECQNATELDEPDTGVLIYWKRAAGNLTGVLGCTFVYGLLGGYCYTIVCAKNILATILFHSICNMLGPPPLRFINEGSLRKRALRAIVYVAGVVGWAVVLSKMRRR